MQSHDKYAESMDGSSDASGLARGKILVAYFSWSGNTREVANQIHRLVGGDLFEIVSIDQYPSDYDECVEHARRELDAGYKPKLKSEVRDIESYDIVFIGYPNWWGTIPRPVASFLSRFDALEKTIVPFCTHGGGRLGRSVSEIASICPRSHLLESLAVQESDVGSAKDRVSAWLRKIGMSI